MYKSTAIACGVHIFGIERQPCNSDTRGKQRIMSNSLYTASSSVSGSWHVLCSIGTVIPRCAPSAQPSITVHHQPFNKVTYQYSLSSYNYSALYQLNLFLISICLICWWLVTNIFTYDTTYVILQLHMG